jgi:hypothetical protein
MTANNRTQSWVKTGDGGIGKAHFSTYTSEFIENNHKVVCGKVIFRGGVTRLNEVHVYVLSEDSINDKFIKRLLVGNMHPFCKNFKQVTKVTIDGVNHTVLILGYSESTFKWLFSGKYDEEVPDNTSILNQLI